MTNKNDDCRNRYNCDCTCAKCKLRTEERAEEYKLRYEEMKP